MPIPNRFAVKVVGVSFRDDYPENLYELQNNLLAGGSIEASLVREPENPADPNAVAVISGGRPLGFIPRDVAEKLAPEIDSGHPFRVTTAELLIHPAHPDRPGLLIGCQRVTT